jgi:aspartate aminotransferase
MKLVADRLDRISPSLTIAMSAKARALKAAGKDVISLSAGEPDFDTPRNVKDAAIAAIERGETKYTDVAGTVALRQAVCARFKADHGVDFTPDEILVATGGKQVIFDALLATIGPGDEAIIPSPCWVSYPDIVELAEGKPVIVACDQNSGFKLRPEQLEAAITPRTKWFILNNPCNPTGAAYSAAELKALTDVLVRHPDVWVFTDDIYGKLAYDGFRPATVLEVEPRLRDRAVTMNGCSKAYAMTGWRIGYAAGPRELIRAMTDVQSQVTSNPSSVAQWAAVEALGGAQDEVAKMAGEFDRRRRLIVAGLKALPGVSCVMPKGAFYAFANVSGLFGRTYADGAASVTIKGSVDVTAFLLERAQVAVVPGVDFGSDAHVRLSYATSDALISEGLQRMAAAIATLG